MEVVGVFLYTRYSQVYNENYKVNRKGVKGIALDVQSAAAVVAEFQHQMMERYEFMQHQQVNNIYQIKDIEVDYYEYNNVKYQFDELFTLTVDLDPKDRNYEKLKMSYTTGRQPLILSMKNIYEGLLEGKWDGRHPQMPVLKGVNSYIDRNSIRKSKGKFVVKAMLLLCDEMNELNFMGSIWKIILKGIFI